MEAITRPMTKTNRGARSHVITLPASDLPTSWYNVLADLPFPLAPPISPATGAAGDAQELLRIFPPGLLEQEMSPQRVIPIPEEVLEILAMWRPTPLVARAPPRAGARHAGAHLLQARGGLAGRQPQAQHRGAAGVLQQGARHHPARHRDRRRPVGQRAGVRHPHVRHGLPRLTWCA